MTMNIALALVAAYAAGAISMLALTEIWPNVRLNSKGCRHGYANRANCPKCRWK